MARSLVIVESPAKARTINRYLGKDFIVKSSIGHIRDLPMGGKASDPKARAQEAAKTRKLSPKAKETYRKKRARDQLVRRMGVDPEHDWKATYEILPGKEKVVDELRRLAEKADQIFLATDLDREGEAIAWHLKEAIGGDPQRYRRVVFNEITRKAIQEAFANPTSIDLSRVSAQQARRFLDRVVGFELSPLLWAKVARGLSAGRVQSVAVRLIVEREREIRAFIPEEYWEAFADLHRPGDDEIYRFQVFKDRGENYRPVNTQQSDDAMARLRGKPFTVVSREDRPDDDPAQCAVHHLHIAASGKYATVLQRQEDDDDGAAALRSRLHHLYAYRFDEPVGGCGGCGSRIHRQNSLARSTCRKRRIPTRARRRRRRLTKPFGRRT